MNLEDLEEIIQSIISLVNKIDEPYRQKCFEILLQFYLKKDFKETPPAAQIETKEEDLKEVEELLIPIDVRAFLQQYNIAEELLNELFVITKDAIRPSYIIKTTKKSLAQIQTALLTALENAISGAGKKFEFSMEDIRKRCKDRQIYDAPHFKAHFKNNSKLFKSLTDDNVELSPDGFTELAEVIMKVAKK